MGISADEILGVSYQIVYFFPAVFVFLSRGREVELLLPWSLVVGRWLDLEGAPEEGR